MSSSPWRSPPAASYAWSGTGGQRQNLHGTRETRLSGSRAARTPIPPGSHRVVRSVHSAPDTADAVKTRRSGRPGLLERSLPGCWSEVASTLTLAVFPTAIVPCSPPPGPTNPPGPPGTVSRLAPLSATDEEGSGHYQGFVMT